MDKKKYLESWNWQNNETKKEIKPLEEQLNGMKQVGKYRIRVWPWFGIGIIVAVILGFIIPRLCDASFLISIAVALGSGLLTFVAYIITHKIVDKDLINAHRKTRGQRYDIERKIEKIRDNDGDIKYNLSKTFAAEYLEDVNIHKDFHGSYWESEVEYGRKFNTETDEYVTDYILKSFAGADVESVGGDLEWRDVYSVPMFHIRKITKKYRKSEIEIFKEHTNWAKFTASQPRKGFSNLEVSRPAVSKKRNWPKKMPKLNGEYYPAVSKSSDEQEIFKFFTPRVIDFFLNEKEDMIKEIVNNDICFNDIYSSLERFEIPSSWRSDDPKTVESSIVIFAMSNKPADIDLDLVDEILVKTDTLHR